MPLRRLPRRSRALVAAALLVAPALSSCGFNYATDRVDTPGAGVNDREKSVDVVLVSQVVHHLSPASAIELSTKSTAASSVIQKRVIRSSVIVSVPVSACCLKIGTTLPRLPTTLP